LANQVHDQPTAEADRKERRAAITLGVLIVGFMVCWTPHVVVVIVQNIFRQEVHVMFFVISNLIGWLNSLINPVIYAVRNPEFQRAFKKVINVIFVGIPSRMFYSVRDLCRQ
jgi:predicted membrane protein